MKLPAIAQLVKSTTKTRFLRYEDRKLWYEQKYWVDNVAMTFEFPVPENDTDDAVFLAEDKPIFFMRWMRQHLEFLQRAIDIASGKCPPPKYAPPDPTRVGRPYPPGVR